MWFDIIRAGWLIGLRRWIAMVVESAELVRIPLPDFRWRLIGIRITKQIPVILRKAIFRNCSLGFSLAV